MTQERCIVFSNSRPGRERDYNEWFTKRHINEALEVPGVLNVQAFEAAMGSSPYDGDGGRKTRWNHMAVYALDGQDAEKTASALEGLLKSAGDAVDNASTLTFIGSATGPWIPADNAQPHADDSSPYRFFTLSNAFAGREEEYRKFYYGDHVQLMLKNPGFKGGQRFELSRADGEAPDFQILALYAVDVPDPQEILAEIARRAGTPALPRADASDRSRFEVGVFKALTPPLSAPVADGCLEESHLAG